MIHTYEGDGQPLPAFTGEPRKIVIPEGLGTLTEELWQALDEENKVSLYVSFIDLETGKASSIIRNKHC